MITATQLRSGTAIQYKGQPYKVVTAQYHPGEWNFGWYATRLGPYREEPLRSFPSLGGAWSYENQPTSITQDSNSQLVFTNEMGARSNGTFADTSTVIGTDWEGGLR